MREFLLCECGQQIDAPGAQPGQVVECPKCHSKLPIPAASPEEMLRQMMQTQGTPGVFAHVQLEGDAPARPASWWQRLWSWLGGKK
jgi:hypothetical protein